MESIKNRLCHLGPLCGFFTAFLGIAVLAAWSLGLNFITAIRTDYIAMAPSTALLFVLCGFSLVLRNLNIYNEHPSRVEKSLAYTILLAALLLFVLSVQQIYSNWEYLGVPISGSIVSSPIGHMSPITATGFIAVTISLFCE